MKFSSALLLVAAASIADAHYKFPRLVVNGKPKSADWMAVRKTKVTNSRDNGAPPSNTPAENHPVGGPSPEPGALAAHLEAIRVSEGRNGNDSSDTDSGSFSTVPLTPPTNPSRRPAVAPGSLFGRIRPNTLNRPTSTPTYGGSGPSSPDYAPYSPTYEGSEPGSPNYEPPAPTWADEFTPRSPQYPLNSAEWAASRGTRAPAPVFGARRQPANNTSTLFSASPPSYHPPSPPRLAYVVSPTGTIFWDPFKTPESGSSTCESFDIPGVSPGTVPARLPHSRHFLEQRARRRNAVHETDADAGDIFGPPKSKKEKGKKKQGESEDADDEKSGSN